LPELTDDILSRCVKGDLVAFRKLVETFQPYAYALSLRILCEPEDARDVVQESFIRVWKHLPQYDVRKKFTTWLYKIVTNLCYDLLKSRERKSKWIVPRANELQEASSPSGENPEMRCVNKDLIDRIKVLAEGLTPKQRIVFILRDLQDLAMQEVMEITGLSSSKVKSNLYHARMNIREKLLMLEKESEK